MQDCRKPQAHSCKLPNTTGPFLSVVSITAIDSLHERRQRKNPVPGLINKSQLRRKGQLDYRSHMLGTSSTPPPTKHTATKLLASNSTIAIADVADTTARLRARLVIAQVHSKIALARATSIVCAKATSAMCEKVQARATHACQISNVDVDLPRDLGCWTEGR